MEIKALAKKHLELLCPKKYNAGHMYNLNFSKCHIKKVKRNSQMNLNIFYLIQYVEIFQQLKINEIFYIPFFSYKVLKTQCIFYTNTNLDWPPFRAPELRVASDCMAAGREVTQWWQKQVWVTSILMAAEWSRRLEGGEIIKEKPGVWKETGQGQIPK